jgi:hypothetical protein
MVTQKHLPRLPGLLFPCGRASAQPDLFHSGSRERFLLLMLLTLLHPGNSFLTHGGKIVKILLQASPNPSFTRLYATAEFFYILSARMMFAHLLVLCRSTKLTGHEQQ